MRHHQNHAGRGWLCLFTGLLLLGVPAAVNAKVIVYPCPWVPESQKAAQGNLTDGITFSNLPVTGELSIYTVDGMLVRRAAFNDPSGRYQWLGTNDAGEEVASGVYYWVVQSDYGTTKGKLIVIR